MSIDNRIYTAIYLSVFILFYSSVRSLFKKT